MCTIEIQVVVEDERLIKKRSKGEGETTETMVKMLHTSPFSLTFSSSYVFVSKRLLFPTCFIMQLTLYGAYHFASRVFPLYSSAC